MVLTMLLHASCDFWQGCVSPPQCKKYSSRSHSLLVSLSCSLNEFSSYIKMFKILILNPRDLSLWMLWSPSRLFWLEPELEKQTAPAPALNFPSSVSGSRQKFRIYADPDLQHWFFCVFFNSLLLSKGLKLLLELGETKNLSVFSRKIQPSFIENMVGYWAGASIWTNWSFWSRIKIV